jgi:two-component system, NarL family, sensor kinase
MAGPSETQAYLIFAIGTAGMLFMAVAIILFVAFYQKRMLREQLRRQHLEADYQRNLMAAQIESQERERARISKDLHDDVGVMMQAMQATVFAVVHQASEEDRKDIQNMVKGITENVRKICWDLMPSSMQQFGLTEAIDEMCSRLKNSGLPVSVERLGAPIKIDVRDQLQLYRMAKEMVTNALKHAKATTITVGIHWQNEHLILQVRDNGVGFKSLPISDNPPLENGLGLLSLKSRASLLNAQLTFEKNLPSGTCISILYPITHAQN